MPSSTNRSDRLGALIAAHKDRIVELWADIMKSRFGLELVRSQLVDHLPALLDETVELLRTLPETPERMESARRHGRQRMELGMDIRGLTREILAVGEAIAGVAGESGVTFSNEEVGQLCRLLGANVSESVGEYAVLRDQQLAEQAAKHFSLVAHEIRTPLQTAMMSTELLRVAGESTATLDRLQRSLAQLDELVDNSLIAARMYGETKLELETLPVSALIDSTCEAALPGAEARDVTISTEVRPFELRVDSKVMISALTNLVTNAVKFTAQGTRVLIRARRDHDRAVFEVEDQCGGLSPQASARLFQPYAQTGDDRTGFGLGLTIVKEAVESHEGTLRVKNMPGKGCCFVIDIPLKPQPDLPAMPDAPEALQ